NYLLIWRSYLTSSLLQHIHQLLIFRGSQLPLTRLSLKTNPYGKVNSDHSLTETRKRYQYYQAAEKTCLQSCTFPSPSEHTSQYGEGLLIEGHDNEAQTGYREFSRS